MIPEEIYNSFIDKVNIQYELAISQINNCFDISIDSCTFNIQLFETINDCASKKDNFIKEFFQSGPVGLTNKNGLHHSLYYQAVQHTHNLGMNLINLPMTLSNSVQYDA